MKKETEEKITPIRVSPNQLSIPFPEVESPPAEAAEGIPCPVCGDTVLSCPVCEGEVG